MIQTPITSNQPFVMHIPPASVEPSPRWVRVKFGGAVIADSKRVLLLRQYGPGRLPTYYFPRADVRTDALIPAASARSDGDVAYWTVRVADQVAELAALQDYISFEWDKMEAWFEEEEEVFVHDRDTYHRVDVVRSSRHVRLVIAGTTVAETQRPSLLSETTLPTRYYIPREDVRMELLEPTSLTTRCPYKGLASYWSAKIGDHVSRNVAWSYPDPIAENPKIKGLICFFNERVDLYVDGELQPCPRTPWSE